MKQKIEEIIYKVNEKLKSTPEQRGFKCMDFITCTMCIKAAIYGQTTTPCEDELEDPNFNEKDKYNKGVMGYFSTPHRGEILTNRTAIKMKSKHIYRCWLRLDEGGVMGLPYPAKSTIDAYELGYRAAKIFSGKVIYIEDMGLIDLK